MLLAPNNSKAMLYNRHNQRLRLNYLKISEIFAGRESSEGPDTYKKGMRCYIRIG